MGSRIPPLALISKGLLGDGDKNEVIGGRW
jgi:hypothetical protein